MRNEDDAKKIWQSQPTEPSIMTLEKIRQKTQELHAKTRRALLGRVFTPLLVIGVSAYLIAQVDVPALRPVFVFTIAWSLAGQYILNRGMWSVMLPGDAALSTGLESYRREVERQRYVSRRFLLWFLAPVVLALILPVASFGIKNPGVFVKMTPYVILMVIWIVSILVIRLRDQRQLQREIDELNDIERANRL
jgi:hypothetical protein